MRFQAVTETGSVYEIDPVEKTWAKNGQPDQALVEWRSGDRALPPVLNWPHTLRPVVGESMFIQGPDLQTWLVTTRVTDCKELEDGIEETMRGVE